MAKIVVVCLISCLGFFFPDLANAVNTSERVRKIGRTVFELQQSFLELKEDFDKKDKAWKSQQEDFQLLVGRLRKENEELLKQVIALRNESQKFDEKLEASSTTKLSNDFEDLERLLKSIILDTLAEKSHSENLILSTINNPISEFPKDLLIFYLASKNRHLGELQESLGYYSTLVSQFPDSPYLSRSVFEMSEVFGTLGMKNEQNTLLLQLSLVDEQDIFTIKAKQKLKELETIVDQPLNESVLATDSTADISKKTIADEAVFEGTDSQTDVTPDSPQKVAVPEKSENGQVSGQKPFPEKKAPVKKEGTEDVSQGSAHSEAVPKKKEMPENVSQGSSPEMTTPVKEGTIAEVQQESTPEESTPDKADSLEGDEPESKAEEPESKAEEPEPKADEHESKAEEPESKADEPVTENEVTATEGSQGPLSEDTSQKTVEGNETKEKAGQLSE